MVENHCSKAIVTKQILGLKVVHFLSTKADTGPACSIFKGSTSCCLDVIDPRIYLVLYSGKFLIMCFLI